MVAATVPLITTYRPLLKYKPWKKLWPVLPVGVKVAKITGSDALEFEESYTVMVGVLEALLMKIPLSLPAPTLIWVVAEMAV
jgi:hypothetical protein